MKTQIKFIVIVLLFVNFGCKKQSEEPNNYPSSSKYLIQAEMEVNLWSIHFAKDQKKGKPSEYKGKIMFYGKETDRYNQKFSIAYVWFSANEDKTVFENGNLTTWYREADFNRIISLLKSGKSMKIEYSLTKDSSHHVTISTTNRK